ncbi:uncharacterized protein EAE97_009189 [Botrytis byssoidea]|uniref:Uncharacterized protein n=1 Tax=Botrytis byssoidea TaxID=139641 RepID=A0A9P5I7P3_9HELO|nr:uncharacterized protein EAE97_009189 [Botrytis byssoidea]KAF7930980.1 hypothetical protein EAE97_009189 [Botrytis byssoidea]
MRFILPLSLSLMGFGLSVVHTFMDSHVEVLTPTRLKQPSIISSLSLLPTVQNIAFLATLPALGIYTLALISIGIMPSNVQALSFGPGGLDHTPHLPPSPLASAHKQRAHPRDISVVATSIMHENSYHVAEALIKKFGDLLRRVNSEHVEFESSGSLLKFAALGRDSADKGESTNIDPHESCTGSSDQHHVTKSDLKIQRNSNTLQSGDVKSGSLISRSRWQDFIHLCWGLGAHYDPHKNRCDGD